MHVKLVLPSEGYSMALRLASNIMFELLRHFGRFISKQSLTIRKHENEVRSLCVSFIQDNIEGG